MRCAPWAQGAVPPRAWRHGAQRALAAGASSGAPSRLVTRECAGMTVAFHETLPHWVGGRKMFAPAGARLLPKLYPATGELLCSVPVADEATVDEAVGVAREAFGAWSAMSGAERGRILNKAASYLYEAHPELARLEVSPKP